MWRGIFRACLWIVPILAVGIGVFLLVVQHARLSEAGGKFLSSMVYSIVIGMPSAILLNWAGFRFTERFPRLVVLINAAVLLVHRRRWGALLGRFCFIFCRAGTTGENSGFRIPPRS